MPERFFSASDKRTEGVPTESLSDQDQASVFVNGKVRELAKIIDLWVPNGRNKSIAMTALEDVQMRSNRGIFAPNGLR